MSRITLTQDVSVDPNGYRVHIDGTVYSDDRLQVAQEAVLIEAARVAELERMLRAWVEHRNEPVLLADWYAYLKDHS